MNEILMTNIFFCITAIAVILLTIAVIILLVYVIRLVNKIHALTSIITDEAEKITQDIGNVRDTAKATMASIAAGKLLRFISQKVFGNK